MAIRNYPKMAAGGRHLEFVRIENSAIRSAVPENPTLEQNMKWIGRLVAEIWPFEIFFKMAAAAILDLFEMEIAPLDPRICRPRKPHPRTKHEVDRTTGCGDIAT